MRANVVWLMLLAAVLLVAAVLSLGVGPVGIPPGRVVDALLPASESGASSTDATIVWELRLPRILLACFVGAGLGAAGAGYQGLFRNALVDPFIIGASSGAALGATLVIVLGFDRPEAIPLAALIGSLLAVGIVYSIASLGGQAPLLSMLLAGVAVSSFIGAVVSLLMFLNDEKLVTIFGWLMGSLSGRGWSALRVTAPLIIFALISLWMLARPLDALTFGEETAMSLGITLPRLRAMVVVAASLATAAAVSAGGVIGFVGLISPHLARLLFGARHALVIPASGLLGGILLVVADDLARVVAAPAEIPVGVVTSLLGSPFFLVLLKVRQRDLGSPP